MDMDMVSQSEKKLQVKNSWECLHRRITADLKIGIRFVLLYYPNHHSPCNPLNNRVNCLCKKLKKSKQILYLVDDLLDEGKKTSVLENVTVDTNDKQVNFTFKMSQFTFTSCQISSKVYLKLDNAPSHSSNWTESDTHHVTRCGDWLDLSITLTRWP